MKALLLKNEVVSLDESSEGEEGNKKHGVPGRKSVENLFLLIASSNNSSFTRKTNSVHDSSNKMKPFTENSC